MLETAYEPLIHMQPPRIEGTPLDSAIHTVTLILSAGIFVVSALAYYKRRNRRFLFIFAGFGLFFMKEVSFMFGVIINFPYKTTVGVTHILNLFVLVLFFFGLLR
ncbi:MAG: hypothetical protein SV253_06285 [Halobacteria archaeon]|nr:hypothetical protein [Halobacteria archaeon]